MCHSCWVHITTQLFSSSDKCSHCAPFRVSPLVMLLSAIHTTLLSERMLMVMMITFRVRSLNERA